MIIHTDAFAHGSLNTQARLHTEVFTQRNLYTEKFSHAEPFTHKSFHTEVFTQRSFYTQKFLHTEAFTQNYTEVFTQRRFYTKWKVGQQFFRKNLGRSFREQAFPTCSKKKLQFHGSMNMFKKVKGIYFWSRRSSFDSFQAHPAMTSRSSNPAEPTMRVSSKIRLRRLPKSGLPHKRPRATRALWWAHPMPPTLPPGP